MKVNILSNKISWFGKYSGYECLAEYFTSNVKLQITSPNDQFIGRVIGKILQLVTGWNHVRPAEIFAEFKFANRSRKAQVSHILYLESHIHSLKLIRNNKNLVGTIHLPFNQWKTKNLDMLYKLDKAIILYTKEISQFERYMDKSKIYFIRHGIDTVFFKPDLNETINRNKILFIGHYLRDFKMFMDVYNLITNDKTRNIEFHFIIPSTFRHLPDIQTITRFPNTFFHEGLSDAELLRFYQTSYLLLMPMEDSGANTAIVQAISTGLPVVTTDVGGIRSYGGGEVFPIVSEKDILGMAQLFEKYYHNEEFRMQISRLQRKFALEQLDWRNISQKHEEVYKANI